MTKPTNAEFRAYELQWEPALAQLLRDAGQPVCSPFAPILEDGSPDLRSIPDDACFVTYEAGNTSADILAFRASPRYDTGLAVDAVAFSGTIVVTRRVPNDDAAPAQGETPTCYAKLCRELGTIRSIFLDSERPFAALLPWYDVLQIEETQPNKQVDGPRSANQMTLRFAVRFAPASGAID